MRIIRKGERNPAIERVEQRTVDTVPGYSHKMHKIMRQYIPDYTYIRSIAFAATELGLRTMCPQRSRPRT